MPYHVGAKGSHGCSGYPAVKDTGEVMGCHKTRADAAGQIYAINRSEGNIKSLNNECCPDEVEKKAPCWEGYVQRGMKEKNGKMVPNCVPVEKSDYDWNTQPRNSAVSIQLREQTKKVRGSGNVIWVL